MLLDHILFGLNLCVFAPLREISASVFERVGFVADPG
jgi:hypothetical protein